MTQTNTVWKFSLWRDVSRLYMPADAKVIHVGVQNSEITLWVWMDPNAENVDRCFEIIGTGWNAPDYDKSAHIGTVFEGPFVWHVFERLS